MRRNEIARLKVQLVLSITMLMITISVLFFTCLTRAWYLNTARAQIKQETVEAETIQSSMYIKGAGSSSKDNKLTLNVTNNKTLSPISTTDLTNWYYVNSWVKVNGKAVADGYKKADIADDATFTNEYLDNITQTAYAKYSATVYTNGDTMDVYLAPYENGVSPISVNYDEDAATSGKKLPDGLRIALVVDGTVKFIYAPGDDGKTDVTYYAVDNTGAVDVSASVVSKLDDYVASHSDDDPDYFYTAGTTSICSADTDGTQIDMYVWLEGTDADTVLGLTDGAEQTLTINLKLVGVIQ